MHAMGVSFCPTAVSVLRFSMLAIVPGAGPPGANTQQEVCVSLRVAALHSIGLQNLFTR